MEKNSITAQPTYQTRQRKSSPIAIKKIQIPFSSPDLEGFSFQNLISQVSNCPYELFAVINYQSIQMLFDRQSLQLRVGIEIGAEVERLVSLNSHSGMIDCRSLAQKARKTLNIHAIHEEGFDSKIEQLIKLLQKKNQQPAPSETQSINRIKQEPSAPQGNLADPITVSFGKTNQNQKKIQSTPIATHQNHNTIFKKDSSSLNPFNPITLSGNASQYSYPNIYNSIAPVPHFPTPTFGPPLQNQGSLINNAASYFSLSNSQPIGNSLFLTQRTVPAENMNRDRYQRNRRNQPSRMT